MATQADGTVYINSSIDTDGFTAGGKEIEAAARRAAKTVKGIGDAARIALERQTAAFVKSNQLYAQQEQKVQDLENKLLELGQQKIPTEGFKKLEKEAEALNIELEKVKATQKEWIDMGFSESDAISKTKKEYDAIIQKIEQVKQKQAELEKAGTAYTAPDTSGVEQKLIAEKQRLMQMNTALNVSYDALKNKIEQYGGSIAGAAQKHGLLRKALSSVAGAAKKAGAAILLLHKNTKKSNGSVGTGIKNMLKYTLGISSLLMLFRKIKSAVKEGIQNLAQYSGETNTHLSALKSSITQLKNSLATAFNPILTVIEPILTRFINLLSQAATYVGMFFASLTGQTTFTKAVAVWEDYANSIGAAADNAKKALKYLSGLDEIRTYSEDKDTGYQAPTPAEMFKTVSIESKIKEFADKVKQTLSEIFAPLKESWDKYGGSIKQSFHDLIEDLLNGDFFEAGQDLSHLIFGIFNLFTDAIKKVDWKGIGNKIGEFLSGIDWTEILSSVGDFIWTAINAAIELWEGALDAAPIETSIITAIGLLKFTGLGFAIMEAIKKALPSVISIGAGVALSINNISSILSGKYENASFKSAIKTAISGLLVGIGVALATGTGIAIPIAVGLAFVITDIVVNWENYRNALVKGQEGIKSLITGDWKTAMDLFQEAAIEQMTADSWGNKVTKAIVDAIFGEGTWESALQNLQSDNSVFRKLGEYVTEGFKSGVIAPFANMQNWIKENIVDPFVGAFKKLFGINSPSTVMREQGVFVMQGLINGIMNLFTSVLNKFNALKTSILGVFTNMRTSISTIWSGISLTIKNSVNSIIGFINRMINGVISGMNYMIEALNSISFTTPDWLPFGWGGKSFGLDIPTITAPQIPYLATGAVIPPNAPFMAVLGDQKNGKNLELPENLLRQIVREESNGQGFNGTIRIPITLNGRQILEAVVDAAKLQQTVSGNNPLAFT